MFDYEIVYGTTKKAIFGFTYDGHGYYNIHHIIAGLAAMGATDPCGNELGHTYYNGPVKLWMFIIDERLYVVDESDIEDMNDPDRCMILLSYEGEWMNDMLDVVDNII